MLFKISNSARDYAWGSRTLIPDYFGLPATGTPMAEIWFGTHSGSPTMVSDFPGLSLKDKLGGKDLPFLLKILAADAPLSIQAHPKPEQAVAGFERENAAGIPLHAANRNYKDDRHKPEIIYALSDFEALCGFKPIKDLGYLFEDMASHGGVSDGFRSLSEHWGEMLQEPEGLQKVFSDISHRRGNLDGFTAELAQFAEWDARFELADRLNRLYPGDPGVVIAMLMNHIYLEPGQALYLPAGNIHAYLGGLGIELMASSDNVLRGGLTPKHIDVDELENVIDFSAGKIGLIQPEELTRGLTHFPSDVDDFMFYRAEVDGSVVLADLNLPGDSIFLCISGEVAVSDSIEERLVLKRGEAAYMSADARLFSLAGSGTVIIATSTSR